MAVETKLATNESTGWSGLEAPAGMVPDLTVISGAPAPGTPMVAERNRPFAIKLGKAFRGVFDQLIGTSSRVPNTPVLDVRDFPWTALLRDNWRAIREEAEQVALRPAAVPSLATISPDHRSIAEIDKWRSFFLFGYGYAIEEN
ncbi:MAG: aspartyl/asparaginyl beta-hydroxylase domain-containing protein, partial [Sphingomonas sp.]|nr:aspartyl/asparaginyl beta-hydroxylase domain-containing protein [Sphingomonas sp.]